MKLSEYKNEAALDFLADIVEPAAEIFGDSEVFEAMQKKPAVAVRVAIKKHKHEVLEILAAMNGTDVEHFECNIFTLPKMALELFNDPDLLSFFTSQA